MRKSPKVVLEHLKALAAGEINRHRIISSIYEQFRLALFDALGGDIADKMTIGRLAGYRREIDRAIELFATKLDRGLRVGLVEAAGMARRHVFDEIRVFQAGIGERYVALNIRASVVLSRAEKLLVSQYESSIARYSEHLRGRISKVLADGALKNATIDGLTKELAGTKGLVRAESYQVERIARTEYLRAHNIGRHEAAREARKVLPDLKRRWDATLDSRVCVLCEAAHGQVAELDEPFDVDGEEIMTPPAHPNCRCAEIPYREAWAKEFD